MFKNIRQKIAMSLTGLTIAAFASGCGGCDGKSSHTNPQSLDFDWSGKLFGQDAKFNHTFAGKKHAPIRTLVLESPDGMVTRTFRDNDRIKGLDEVYIQDHNTGKEYTLTEGSFGVKDSWNEAKGLYDESVKQVEENRDFDVSQTLIYNK
tara:strand:- start:682 stop:1131 length:450 start_codon:yes stop_codon:yes gene_type:complete